MPANENICGGFSGEKVPLVAGQLWLGTKPEDIGLTLRPGANHIGELQAWDPATGKKVWSHNFPKSQLFGSVTVDRGRSGPRWRHQRSHVPRLRCQDRRTAVGAEDQLRHHGHAVSYEVDGTQYIAVQSGWGVDAQRIQDALATQNIGFENNVPQGGVVWVFAVKK